VIQLFTLGQPDPAIKDLATDIFALPKGAYNLISNNYQQKELFDRLYLLGVRQVIHDGKADLIECLDGYLYAENLVDGKSADDKDVLRIEAAR